MVTKGVRLSPPAQQPLRSHGQPAIAGRESRALQVQQNETDFGATVFSIADGRKPRENDQLLTSSFQLPPTQTTTGTFEASKT